MSGSVVAFVIASVLYILFIFMKVWCCSHSTFKLQQKVNVSTVQNKQQKALPVITLVSDRKKVNVLSTVAILFETKRERERLIY